METGKVSKKLLTRLPQYLTYIKSLPPCCENISATKMAKDLGLGDVLVRKDLAKISDGGRRKLGYVRSELMRDIELFLDVNRTMEAVVVGAGKLGQALLDYSGFEAAGLRISAGFDIHIAKRHSDGGKTIYPMNRLKRYCEENGVSIAVLTVPADSAQEVCDTLVACGIRAIWNFAPTHLNVPEYVAVQSENLAISLTALRMQLKTREISH
jgi:redox-sensing transcriptional repressor